MSNEYYNHTTYPIAGSQGSSALLRAELDAVSAGFDKLPTMAGNGNKLVLVNASGTGLVATNSLTGLTLTGGTFSSPALTGTPTAPTATAGTSTTQVATTAFVQTVAFNAALPAQAGNAGKYVTTDGANASWATVNIPPADGTLFTATGAIAAAGVSVALRTDGTVEAVAETTAASAGTPVVFESATANYCSAVYDPVNNVVVVAYADGGNSDYGTAVVGSVSGTTITFGTPVVFESARADYVSACYDVASGKIVIAYTDFGNSSYGTAVVGTVAYGNTISFGTPVVFESASTDWVSIAYDAAASKVVVAYRDVGNSNQGTAIVGTVSGTSITFGNAVVYNTGNTQYVKAIADTTNNKVVVVYQDAGNSNRGTAVVGTVSGANISFGAETVFAAGTTSYVTGTFNSVSGVVVIAYQNASNSNYGTAIVGTVSGTSISFGTAAVFESASTLHISAEYGGANRILIAYQDDGNSAFGTAVVGTVSGTSISFGTPIVFESASTSYTSVVVNPFTRRAVIAYRDGGNSNYGTAAVFTSFTTNADKFIGFAQSAAANATPVYVAIAGGADGNQTGLTQNTQYWVRSDGALVSSNTELPLAGKALSATKIQVDLSRAPVFPPQSANAGKTLVTDGTSISWASKSGTSFTAASQVPLAGTPVALRSDGQVEPIAETVAALRFGTPTLMSGIGYADNLVATLYDSSQQRVVLIYRDGSGFGQAIVGRVQRDAISWGTPVAWAASALPGGQISAAFDSTNNRVVIAFRNTSNSQAIVGTVSNLSISFGTAVTFWATSMTVRPGVAFDTASGKVVVAYRDNVNGLSAVVGTVSGTTISFGSPVVADSNVTGFDIVAAADPSTGKVVIVHDRSNILWAYVGTVSGSTISFGAAASASGGLSTSGVPCSLRYTTGGALVLSYVRGGTDLFCRVCTVSGTSLTVNAEINIPDVGVNYFDTAWDSFASKFVTAYYTPSTVRINAGTISGSTITFSGEQTSISANAWSSGQSVSLAYVPAARRCVLLSLSTSPSNGAVYAQVVANSTDNLSRFIGYAQSTAGVGTTVAIDTGGEIDSSQTGLTQGALYYLQTDGTLTTDNSLGQLVTAGRAVSSTRLMVSDWSARTPVWTAITSSGIYTVPAGVWSIRAYAFGKGGNAVGAYAGAGGGCAYGDIAVTPGSTVSISISAGVATVTYGGTTLLTANPGADGSVSGVSGGTATKHASVINGGAFSGGATNTTSCTGGASSGSPLGAGYATPASQACGGSGWGGSGGSSFGGGGGGVGGQGSGMSGSGAGGAGGSAPNASGGVGRDISNFYTEPLLALCVAPGGHGMRVDGGPTGSWYVAGGNAGPGGGGGGVYSALTAANAYGGAGGLGGGGGGAYCNGAGSATGGVGGLGGGGGGANTSGGTSTGGNGGYGGGGGGGGSTQGTGGAAIVLIYA